MSRFRQSVRGLINTLGYDVYRLNRSTLGIRPEDDLKTLIRSETPMIFDVGANVGESIEMFRRAFPSCTIHAFEPSGETYALLRDRAGRLEDVRLWNLGVASTPGTLPLNENEIPKMTSFLPLGRSGWGRTKATNMVKVTTVDAFCRQEGIDRIDILKSDTQGFELEVLKGAESSLRSGNVGAVFCEINFIDIYEGLPSPWDIVEFLKLRGFEFVTFYRLHYRNGVAAWTDALFAHERILSPPARG